MNCTNSTKIRIGVVVPTFNAGQQIVSCLKPVLESSLDPVVLVVDSSSSDDTARLATELGVDVLSIPQLEFDHGGTRKMATERMSNSDVVVFLTQDAILATADDLQRIVAAFDDENVGVAYGRQLPHLKAGFIATHARLFNYPSKSDVRSITDVPRLGIKTAFASNSFAAYRREALISVGGFPNNLILAEDMVATARILLAGWKVSYCADAQVFHSHDYTPFQELRRYFDIGVLHAREPWLLKRFGNPEGEGNRFVLSELRYLLKNSPYLIPSALFRTVMKYVGYRLGRSESWLSLGVKRRLSMHRGYWRGC